MKKTIITTTINKPTRAIIKFCKKSDWNFIIAGDLKTPHAEYRKLEKKYPNVSYLDPNDQIKINKKLSDSIGWNNIQRRNFAIIEAYKNGADIVATVDDDNIPYDNWGENLLVNSVAEIDLYKTKNKVFDPLSVTKSNFLWHRGYPIDMLKMRKNIKYSGKIKRKILVQADLWDGEPDIDAIARIALRNEKDIYFPEIKKPYGSDKISPFNSQNTFLSREVIPYYALFPHIGRMDDIWASYIVQYYFPDSVAYNSASVFQKRNSHNYAVDLEKEIIGYKFNSALIDNLKNYKKFLPEKSIEFLKIFQDQYKKLK